MADKTVLLGQIVAEQEDFAALLRGLTDEQWAASSLCEGWTVRDTGIHTAWHIHLKRIGPVPSFGYARDVSQFLLLGGDQVRCQAAREGRSTFERGPHRLDRLTGGAHSDQSRRVDDPPTRCTAPAGFGTRHSRRSAGLTLELLHVADWRQGPRCRVSLIHARAGIPSCRHGHRLVGRPGARGTGTRRSDPDGDQWS